MSPSSFVKIWLTFLLFAQYANHAFAQTVTDSALYLECTFPTSLSHLASPLDRIHSSASAALYHYIFSYWSISNLTHIYFPSYVPTLSHIEIFIKSMDPYTSPDRKPHGAYSIETLTKITSFWSIYYRVRGEGLVLTTFHEFSLLILPATKWRGGLRGDLPSVRKALELGAVYCAFQKTQHPFLTNYIWLSWNLLLLF